MSDESTDGSDTERETDPEAGDGAGSADADDDSAAPGVTPSGDDGGENGTQPAHATPDADEVFCRDCGAVISEEAEICPACGIRQRDPPKSSVESLLDDLTEGGNPFVAAGLSLVFPGLGQLYNRELQKAILVMVASLVALASVLAFVGVVLYPAVWLFAIYDAYVVADRESEEADGED